MLDLDVAASATIDESGHPVRRAAPEGIRFEALTDDHPLLGTLVGPTTSSARTTRRSGQHGLLVHVPAGVELEKPLYLRVANTVEGGSLFWRVLIVAEPGVAVHGDRGAHVGRRRSSRLRERRRRDRRPGRREGRVRQRPEPLAEDLALRLVSRHASSATPSSTGSRAASARRKGKVWIQNDLADQGATSRVTGAYFADGTQHLDYDTYQLHAAPGHDVATSRSRARCATRRRRCGAG